VANSRLSKIWRSLKYLGSSHRNGIHEEITGVFLGGGGARRLVMYYVDPNWKDAATFVFYRKDGGSRFQPDVSTYVCQCVTTYTTRPQSTLTDKEILNKNLEQFKFG
jgi:hypothetical protein